MSEPTTLIRLQRRATVVFEDSCEAMRASIILRMQSAHLRTLIGKTHIDVKTAHPLEKLDGPALTPRERAVLELVIQGKTTKSIAAELGISFKTAATHRYSAMSKMGVGNAAALVRDSIRMGLGKAS